MNDGEIAFSPANFVIYCLLNIYGGILMSPSPMAAHCQYSCKSFILCLFNLTVLPCVKLFSLINTDIVCQEKCH